MCLLVGVCTLLTADCSDLLYVRQTDNRRAGAGDRPLKRRPASREARSIFGLMSKRVRDGNPFVPFYDHR